MKLTKKLSFYAVILGISLTFVPASLLAVDPKPTPVANSAGIDDIPRKSWLGGYVVKRRTPDGSGSVLDVPIKRTWLGDCAVKRPLAFAGAGLALGLGFFAAAICSDYLVDKWYSKKESRDSSENKPLLSKTALQATKAISTVGYMATGALCLSVLLLGACEHDSPVASCIRNFFARK